jgi:alkaline phosphatase D
VERIVKNTDPSVQAAEQSRRQFITNSLRSAGLIVVSTGISANLTACKAGSTRGRFDHGVASGDPLADRVILWTRITPLESGANLDTQTNWVSWQVATDAAFKNIVIFDSAVTDATHDFTIKIDAQGLKPNQKYYYRFITSTHISPTGETRTLPKNHVRQVKFAVVSCSNYPAGLFHVYGEIAQSKDIDAVLHLGDYIYEYPRGGYASNDAAALNREVLPTNELLSLQDYRTRYAQYRSDSNLQAAHQRFPFITVWDDHEIANDAWRQGAENHNPTEGDYRARLSAALQAYAEWMPIRPMVNKDLSGLQRSFQYGDLVNLIMLDTRLAGRDQALELANYFDTQGTFNQTGFATDLADPSRKLIGEKQLNWLKHQLGSSRSSWQVLGQQVLMGTMELPGAIATQQLSIQEFAELAQIAQIAASNPALLTPEQLQKLQLKGHLLRLGKLPYNLDAWDGYPSERAKVLAAAQQHNSNLVVLAGDTHNGWANNLKHQGKAVGVEFATPSVSSPGLEEVLGLSTLPAVLQVEGAVTQLIDNLQYTNLSNRGYMLVTFTHQNVESEWIYIDSVKNPSYAIATDRNYSISVPINTNEISR